MSTDHQKYSIENQSELIRAYADEHGMRIVRTYADPGRSGLTLKERPALSRLLSDVSTGTVPFEAVLVYDVTRWGRFQDVDESAYYEFACKRAGVRVIYCAEQFAADESPFSSVLKSMKRAMAGEFSRELGVKVAAGKARIGRLGFRIGGIAGYGLRRRVLENGTTPGMLLRPRERKAIQTDRVTLVPGPGNEIAVIRRIYRDYIDLRKSERQIAAALNTENITCLGRPWTQAAVKTILSNEKYIGNNIVGRFSQRLGTHEITYPPEKWIRCEGAFESIVSRSDFDAAARTRSLNEKMYIEPEALLLALKAVLKREGRLTASIISKAPDLPSSLTVIARFGSLGEAYHRIGYIPPDQRGCGAIDRSLRPLTRRIERELMWELYALGTSCSVSESGLIILSDRCTIEVRACRFHHARGYSTGWRIAYQRNLGSSILVALRIDHSNSRIKDVLVVPRSTLPQLPRLIRAEDDALLSSFRHNTVESVARALQSEANQARDGLNGQET